MQLLSHPSGGSVILNPRWWSLEPYSVTITPETFLSVARVLHVGLETATYESDGFSLSDVEYAMYVYDQIESVITTLIQAGYNPRMLHDAWRTLGVSESWLRHSCDIYPRPTLRSTWLPDACLSVNLPGYPRWRAYQSRAESLREPTRSDRSSQD